VPIHSFVQPERFEPEVIAVLSEVFDSACKELDDADQPKVAPEVDRPTNYCSDKPWCGAHRRTVAMTETDPKSLTLGLMHDRDRWQVAIYI
jgi:hypothetical protein